jgi:hypothetical protein
MPKPVLLLSGNKATAVPKKKLLEVVPMILKNDALFISGLGEKDISNPFSIRPGHPNPGLQTNISQSSKQRMISITKLQSVTTVATDTVGDQTTLDGSTIASLSESMKIVGSSSSSNGAKVKIAPKRSKRLAPKYSEDAPSGSSSDPLELSINTTKNETTGMKKKFKKARVEWRVCNICHYSGTSQERAWYVDHRRADIKEETGFLCSTCYSRISRIVRAIDKTKKLNGILATAQEGTADDNTVSVTGHSISCISSNEPVNPYIDFNLTADSNNMDWSGQTMV